MKKLEGSVDELYGYLVCAKDTDLKTGISVYVFSYDSSDDVKRKADTLARKIRRVLSRKRNKNANA